MRAVVIAVAIAAVLAAVALSCRSSVAPSTPSRTSTAGSSAGRALWPNEPAGLATLTDQSWTELVSGGWRRRESTDDRIVKDASAPVAPETALEYVYPAGFQGGTAPATHYYGLRNRRELFVGLEWKVSSPWQGHSTYVNKVQFVYTPTADIAMVMFGPVGGPYQLRVKPQWRENGDVWLMPNVARPDVTLDTWHRIEWYLKYESTYGAGDGIVRWWLDGALVGDYPGVRYPNDAGFNEYQMSPTWGGVGDVKTETDYYRFNRSYISARP